MKLFASSQGLITEPMPKLKTQIIMVDLCDTDWLDITLADGGRARMSVARLQKLLDLLNQCMSQE